VFIIVVVIDGASTDADIAVVVVANAFKHFSINLHTRECLLIADRFSILMCGKKREQI
jgi:hypothetical protein